MAFLLKYILPIVQFLLPALVEIIAKRKAAADASRTKALEKTIESVEESIKVEKDIVKKQDEVKVDNVSTDGGLNFDEFNKGK